MLRSVLVVLVLANVLFFCWARGWLAPVAPPPRHGEREPERLAAQLHPETVTVLAPKAANDAVNAARAAAAACLEAGPLPDSELAAAEAALVPAQLPPGTWLREAVPAPLPWLVLTARVSDAAVRTAREAELRALGLQPQEAPADLAPAFVLSRHATRAEAETALGAVSAAAAGSAASAAAQALRGSRVVVVPVPPPQHLLRVPRADADMQARLQSLPAGTLAGGFKPCAVVGSAPATAVRR